MAKRFAMFAAAAVFALAAAASGGDGIEALNVSWRDFVAAVRRGDYPAAHLMFSEQSRAVFPFQAFVREYGPLSAARETLLADPASLATRVNGDWGEIRFAIRLPVSRREMTVTVAFVRNDGVWSLVAARNEEREQLEAAARDLLRQLLPHLSRPDARELVAAVVAGQPGDNPLTRAYDFAYAQNRLRAIPKLSGLRAFHLDNWGMVKQGMGESAAELGKLAVMPNQGGPAAIPPAPARSVPPPVAVPDRPIIAGAPAPDQALPELAEPPAARPLSGMGELADPGMLPQGDPPPLPPPELPDPLGSGHNAPPPGVTRPAGEPARFSLPDRIS